MSKLQSDDTRTMAAKRPSCPNCGTEMMISRIEPDKPDHDMRTFECPKCNHDVSLVVKYQESIRP